MTCPHKIKHYTNISCAENIFKEKLFRIASDDPLNRDSIFNALYLNQGLGNIIPAATNTNCYIVFEWVGPCANFFQYLSDKYPPDKWEDIDNSVLYNQRQGSKSERVFIRGPINKNCSLKFVGVYEMPSSEGYCKARNKWLWKFMKIFEKKFGTEVQRRIKKLNKLCGNKGLAVQVQGVKWE